ncbi:MAG: DUF1868 domain-containing protein [Armatimonadetes bacterium]|nr:DUF1868 domain-containing protein [Anaerolineae bacterium]
MTDAVNYTMHVNEKFFADGSIRHYPGSTIICFADPASAIYTLGESVQAQLMAEPYGHKFVLLPPSSFHMTVFSLLLDQRRAPDGWSAHVPLEASLADADRHMRQTVATVPAPANFRMVFKYLGGGGLSFQLTPADETSERTLWAYRHALAAATGVRYPDHDTYRFHLTLAYKLIHLTDDEERDFQAFRLNLGETLRPQLGIFDTGAPVLTFFDHMNRFVTADEYHTLETRSAPL